MPEYDATSIEILSGLEPVQTRPGMFTDTCDPNHLAQEVIDNSVDEALAGYAGEIEINLYKDGSLGVCDDGRGMPVDQHPQRKQPGAEVILTTLHAGGKFSNRNYRYAGGLHGVGVSVVNALSDQLEARIRRGGKEYQLTFKNGGIVSAMQVIGKVGRRQTGTTIRFWPNPDFFDTVEFNVGRLKRLLQAKAVLCPNLRMVFRNEADKEETSWHYEAGFSSYFDEMSEGRELLLDEHFSGSKITEDFEVQWCVNWLVSPHDVSFSESYANLVPTRQGGSHVSGLRAGLSAAVREFMSFRNLLPKNMRIAPEDVSADLCYLLSIKVQNPEFTGQAKERLVSRNVVPPVQGALSDAFSLWLNRHPRQGEALTKLFLENARRRSRKLKKATRKNSLSGLNLPAKLADCISNDVSKTELFIVEGDSAGGSAKQARDREYQAILPLRGKILNTWEISHEQALSSAEVHNIALALGVEAGNDDLRKLRYGKICILADADSDGLHIAVLLAGLFKKHFPKLVYEGQVYVALPPLFRIDAGKEVYYVLDEVQRDAQLKKLPGKQAEKAKITRFKGLGEMNPQQLRESVMLAERRRLIQLTCRCGDSADRLIDMLLAKKRSSDRRCWLERKGDLASDLG